MRTLLVVGLLVGGSAIARADGCYICEGGGYVKFAGDDSWAKRHQAEACGCKVQGNVSSCGGPTQKIRCSVAALPQPPRALPVAARR